MPNQIKPEYEAIIYNYITNYPIHGPRRISDELTQQEIIISETGVYHVLKRANLNHRLDRLFYAQEHSDNPVITKRYLREVKKKKETHIEASHPGDLLCQDTFYVGTIKGLAWAIPFVPNTKIMHNINIILNNQPFFFVTDIFFSFY